MDVFVSYPFCSKFNFLFPVVEKVARKRGLEAYFVNPTVVTAPIAETITKKIRESRVVVVDITGNNPNVLHEVGQAQTLGKPLIIITQDDPESAPFNIRSYPMSRYSTDDLDRLEQVIDRGFAEATSPNEILRSMMVPASLGQPTKESRFVIVASPLSYRRAMGRRGGFKDIRRTSSDYVGVRGILQAFGILYGFDALPDVIDPDDFRDEVISKPMNMYCIASPKANRWTSQMLEKLGECWAPRLGFRADPKSKDLKNIAVEIFRNNSRLEPANWPLDAESDRWALDYGIIVRAPNPYPTNGGYMVTVLAGRSSLGTEAACKAFTDKDITDRIRKRLAPEGVDLDNHNQPFWVLVSMRRTIGDDWEDAIPESLELCEVNTFRCR